MVRSAEHSFSLFLLAVRVILFVPQVYYISINSFDEQSVRNFVSNLHVMEAVFYLSNFDLQLIRKRAGIVLSYYFLSFLFFYFLFWTLGAPFFMHSDYFLLNCTLTNYFVMLNSKSFYGELSCSGSEEEFQERSDTTDADKKNANERDTDKSKDEDKVKQSPASEGKIVEVKIRNRKNNRDSIGTKIPGITEKTENDESLKEKQRTSSSSERKLSAAESSNKFDIQLILFNIAPRASFCLLFLSCSSSLYLLDWEEKWQKWPTISVCAAFLGSVVDECYYHLTKS